MELLVVRKVVGSLILFNRWKKYAFLSLFFIFNYLSFSQTLVTWDFRDGDNHSWTIAGTRSSWQYTNPIVGGDGYWGNNGTGNYNNSESSWIISPSVTFGKYITANIVFYGSLDITGNDRGYVQISTNNGSSWTTLRTYSTSLASSTYTVAISPIANYNNKNILVRFRLYSDANDNRDGWYIYWVRIDYTIPPTSINITSPNGGEYWRRGGHYITWTSDRYTGRVNIEYSTNSGSSWLTVVSNRTNNGSYSWNVPANINSNNCLVRIKSVENPNATDISDAPFTISDCGRIWGYVRVNGVPQPYFPVHLNGYIHINTLTDANGKYDFRDLPVPGTGTCGVGGGVTTVNYEVNVLPYVIAASSANKIYSFQFTTSTIEIQKDFNADGFDPNAYNYSISGTVIEGVATPLENVNLTLYQRTPGTTTWTQIEQTTTDSSGNFSFTGLIGYTSYYIIASKKGYKFSPSDDSHQPNGYYYLIDVPGDQTNINFIAEKVPYPPVVLKNPTYGAMNVLRMPTFEWEAAEGATSYELQYSTSPDFSSGVISFSNITGTAKKLTAPLEILTTYYWRVGVNRPGLPTQWSSIWSFRTAAGIISVSPSPQTYPTTVVNRTSSHTFTITNDGDASLRISNISITGTDKDQFNIVANIPINIAPNSEYTFTVNYTPKKVGTHNATLLVDHNDVSVTQNPLEIGLQGSSTSTAVTLNLPSSLNFGSMAYLGGYITKTIEIGNNSKVPGDNLILSSYYFENNNNSFEVLTPFPIVLEPGTTYDLVVKFNPTLLGTQTNQLHIINTSLNAPDAVVTTVGTAIQGGLIVTPTSIDFGNTSVANPFKLQTVLIQNISSSNITISNKSISGDVSSFSFNLNNMPITLGPNQTDTVIVMFMPSTGGRKDGVLNIISDDHPIAPNIHVPMTGIGGEFPVITVIPSEINFGDLQKGQTKDTTVEIRNDGCLDLVITSNSFEGNDKGLFSFITNDLPIVLRHGESRDIIIRVKGDFPIGERNAQLKIASNDPNNPVVNVNLLVTINTPGISTVDRVEFDSIGLGYYIDTTITIKNIGNIQAVIHNLSFDGAFASDFSVVDTTLPLELKGNAEIGIKVRFKPTDYGLRYARLLIYSTDPERPELPVIIKGYSEQVSTDISITDEDGNLLDDGLNFGTVIVFESKAKNIILKNLSRYAKIVIDSIYFDAIEKQPFSYSNLTLPLIIQPKSDISILINFYPHDKVNNYIGRLNIIYRDSTENINQRKTKYEQLIGDVVFPNGSIQLAPVLKFDKVLIGQTKTESFEFKNNGVFNLRIDSIVINGKDADEFSILQRCFPMIVVPQEIVSCSISFTPIKSGIKDAVINIYWNDLFVDGKVVIWAEGIFNTSKILSIKTLEIPTENKLFQNYPNPFNPSTIIKYSILETTPVKIYVYNSIGQVITVLADELQTPGVYQINWLPKNISSGIYFYKIETDKFTSIKKMMFIK